MPTAHALAPTPDRYEALIADLVRFCGGEWINVDQFRSWMQERTDLTPEERAKLTIAMAETVLGATPTGGI